MLSPMQQVVGQYQPLITKMYVDAPKKNIATKNLNLLCDLELIMGLHAILPLLDFVHALIKLA
jgi:hypothetical protein